MHLQYEAWLQAAHRRSPDTEARVEVAELHGGDGVTTPYLAGQHNEYAFFVFEDDAPVFYQKLEEAMVGYEGGPPVFLGVDDDLTVWTRDVLAYHATQLTAFFERHWPAPAPWEADAADVAAGARRMRA